MTKKLQELFDLPPTGEEPELRVEDAMKTIIDNQDLIAEVDDTIDKIDKALPRVKSLDAGDDELDDLAKAAKDRFEDLMDLGMNIDPRFGGVIFQTAGTLLGHAISAKQAKMDRKLRTVALQLQKARLDHQIEKDRRAMEKEADAEDDGKVVDGKGIVLDRNALISQMLQSLKTDK